MTHPPQSYKDYDTIITALVNNSDLPTLKRFCADVVQRMLEHVKPQDILDIPSVLRPDVESLFQVAQNTPFDATCVKQVVHQLSPLINEDDLSTVLAQTIDAIHEWSTLHHRHSKDSARQVAEHHMNLLDFLYTNDTPLSQWLTVPQIQEEFVKQQAFLQNNQL